jgi:hydrogenase maturation factor
VSDYCEPDGHCITCSDEAVPMDVLQVGANGLAVCADDAGSRQDVMTELVGDVAPGDKVLVHAGVALTRVAESPEDFRR